MCNSSTENTHKLYTQQVNKRTKLLAGFASEICCFESNLSVLVHLLRGLDNARFSHCLAELSSVEASDLRSVAPANMALPAQWWLCTQEEITRNMYKNC